MATTRSIVLLSLIAVLFLSILPRHSHAASEIVGVEIICPTTTNPAEISVTGTIDLENTALCTRSLFQGSDCTTANMQIVLDALTDFAECIAVEPAVAIGNNVRAHGTCSGSQTKIVKAIRAACQAFADL